MKNLLFKEIRLCVPAQVWIFVALSALIVVPNWPSLVAFVYPLSGFLALFPIALANRDLLYTGTLPIQKKQIVLGKVMLVCFLELLTLLVSLPFGIIKQTLLIPTIPAEEAYPDLGINMALYGIVLIGFGLFNAAFFPRYYKSPDAKNVAATILAYLASLAFFGIAMAVFMAVPGASEFINGYTGYGLLTQILILVGGALLFFLLNLLAYRKGAKNFQKIDL